VCAYVMLGGISLSYTNALFSGHIATLFLVNVEQDRVSVAAARQSAGGRLGS